MPTARNHPAKYNREVISYLKAAIASATTLSIEFNSEAAAKHMRMELYNLRYSMDNNPEWEPELRAKASRLSFSVHGKTLEIKRK